jgi:hypothetical protein
LNVPAGKPFFAINIGKLNVPAGKPFLPSTSAH